MTIAPAPVKLNRDDLRGAPSWTSDLFDTLNPQLQSVQQALTKGISLGDNLNAKLVQATVTGPAPTWTEIGSDGAPAFKNSWANQGGAYETCAFRMLPGGTVELKGVVSGGSPPSQVFLLPAGYIPAKAQQGPTLSNGAFGGYVVHEQGGVDVYTGSGTSVSLCGIRWQAGSPAAYPLRPTGSGWPLSVTHGLNSVSAVYLVDVEDLDAGTSVSALATSSSIEWSAGDAAGTIRLLSAWGLMPGRKYRLSLLVWG